MFSLELLKQAEDVLGLLRAKGLKLATAESCTGGLIAACLTAIPGSSDVLERGFVTYSNEAKTQMLGVPAELIAQKGAVSLEVAKAMAEGALAHSRADVAISVTGIAGPGGATANKPVGLVCFGLVIKGQAPRTLSKVFAGDRADVRHAAMKEALRLIEESLGAN